MLHICNNDDLATDFVVRVIRGLSQLIALRIGFSFDKLFWTCKKRCRTDDIFLIDNERQRQKHIFLFSEPHMVPFVITISILLQIYCLLY